MPAGLKKLLWLLEATEVPLGRRLSFFFWKDAHSEGPPREATETCMEAGVLNSACMFIFSTSFGERAKFRWFVARCWPWLEKQPLSVKPIFLMLAIDSLIDSGGLRSY